MIFRQLFDSVSCTYSYLLASRRGGEALIIDPVLEKLDHYLRLLRELDLRLVRAVDTHLHADHVTGTGALRDQTSCVTVMGEQSSVDVVGVRVRDGDRLKIDGISLDILYTPGHTDDSYCFLAPDRIFTGDTLLIRGTGRTDFQNGSAYSQYESLQRLMRLPGHILVYPAHDYKGDMVSTIDEERRYNPRLQVDNAEAYADLMANLRLAHPKMMDVAVPANQRQGLDQTEIERQGWAVAPTALAALIAQSRAVPVDVRTADERARTGMIAGALPMDYNKWLENGDLYAPFFDLVKEEGKYLVFYCAFGECSAMLVRAAQRAGHQNARHLHGGLAAWAADGQPLGGS